MSSEVTPNFLGPTSSQSVVLNWSDVDALHRNAARWILELHEPIDVIIAIARGGLTTASHLAYLANIPSIVSIQVSKDYLVSGEASARARLSPTQVSVDVYASLLYGRSLLIVDGAIGSGETMSLVYQLLERQSPASIKGAVIAGWRGCQKYKADLVPELEDIYIGAEYDPWPIFPWEG